MFTFSKNKATKINSMSQVEYAPKEKQKKKIYNKIPPAQMITREKLN